MSNATAQSAVDHVSSAASANPVQPPRSLRGRLFSNAFWSIGGRVASIGAVFLANVVLGRMLSTAEFSAYTISAAAVAFLAMPASFGAPRVVLRLIREGLATERPQMAISAFRSCIRLVATTCVLLSVLFVLGVRLLDADKWRAIADYSVLVAAWFSLSAICLVLSHALQGFDDFRSAAIVGARNGGVLPNMLFLAILAAALATGRLTLWLALSAQVGLHVVALLWAWYAIRRDIARRGCVMTRVSREAPERSFWLFRECWPILVIQLTSLGVAQFDVLLVGWLSQEREIAVYGAVARLGEVLGAAQILAAGIAAPFVSELYASGELRKLEGLLRGIASFVAVPTLLVGVIFLVAPRLVLTYSFGPKFSDGATTLQVVTVGSMIAAFTGTNSLALIMAGRQRQLLSISAMASAAYLLIAPLLIANWGIVGAATATAVVFGLYNIGVTLMVKHLLGIWTFASISPRVYGEALRQVFRR
jgi:O-antigen/teichoic acid export membrane protein